MGGRGEAIDESQGKERVLVLSSMSMSENEVMMGRRKETLIIK